MASSAMLQTPYSPNIQYHPSYQLVYFYSALDTCFSATRATEAPARVQSIAREIGHIVVVEANIVGAAGRKLRRLDKQDGHAIGLRL